MIHLGMKIHYGRGQISIWKLLSSFAQYLIPLSIGCRKAEEKNAPFSCSKVDMKVDLG